MSSLSLSLLGIIGAYLFIRELRQPRWLAVGTAVTLAANPIYYAISNTFMSDVFYIATTMFAALFFVRSLRSRSVRDLVIGTGLAALATLSRQLAICLPLGFGISWVVMHGLKRSNMLRAIMPPLVCCGALYAYQQWLTRSGRLPALYYVKLDGLLDTLTSPKLLFLSVTKNVFVAALYLGLFMLPLLLLIAGNKRRFGRKHLATQFAFATMLMTLGIGVFALRGLRPAVTEARHYAPTYLMPLSGNILTTSGIGPLTLADNWRGGDYAPVLPPLSRKVWIVVTFMSLIGAGLLVAIIVLTIPTVINLVRHRGSQIVDKEIIGVFCVVSVCIYFAPLIVSSYIDRYLVPPIPLIVGGVACLLGLQQSFLWSKVPQRICAGLLIAAMFVFSVGSTGDYLAWNRARWQALKELMENDHVNAKDIDGGFEFNGLYMYDPDYQYDSKKSWWWVQGDTYKVSFGIIPGYTAIKEYRYHNWIPPRQRQVLVLKRQSASQQ